jgi:hypothetical protein
MLSHVGMQRMVMTQTTTQASCLSMLIRKCVVGDGRPVGTRTYPRPLPCQFRDAECTAQNDEAANCTEGKDLMGS